MTSSGSVDDQHEERSVKLEAVARELSERNTALADARARLQELEAEVAARRRKAGNEGDVPGSTWYLALEELYDRVDWISPPMYLSPSCSPPYPPPEGIPRLAAGTTARFRLAPHLTRITSQGVGNVERSHTAAGHERFVEIWSARSQASKADEAAGCPQEVQFPRTSEEAQVEALCSQLAMQAAAIASSHVEGICRVRCEAATPELRAEAAELRAEVHHARGGQEAAGAAQAAASAALATVNALVAANSAALRAQQDAANGAPLAHTMESMQSCLAELQAGAEGLTKAVAATSSQLKQQLHSVAAIADGGATQSASSINVSGKPPAAIEDCQQSSSAASCPEAAASVSAASSAVTSAAVADADAAATAVPLPTFSDHGIVTSGQQQDAKELAVAAELQLHEPSCVRRGQSALLRTSELGQRTAVTASREAGGSRGLGSPTGCAARVLSSPSVSRISSAPGLVQKQQMALDRTSSMVIKAQRRQSPSPNAPLLRAHTSASGSPGPTTRVQSPVRSSRLRQRPPSQAVLLPAAAVASSGCSCCNVSTSLSPLPVNAVPVTPVQKDRCAQCPMCRRIQLPCFAGSSGAPPMPAPRMQIAGPAATDVAPSAASPDAPAAVPKLCRNRTPPRANSPVRMRSGQVFSPLRRTLVAVKAGPLGASATPGVSSSPISSSARSLTPTVASHQQISAVRRFGGEALQSMLAGQSQASLPSRPAQRSTSIEEAELLPTFGVEDQEPIVADDGAVYDRSRPPKPPQIQTVAESPQNLQHEECTERVQRAQGEVQTVHKEHAELSKRAERVETIERSPSPTKRLWLLQSPHHQLSSSGMLILPPPRPAGTNAAGVNGHRVHTAASPMSVTTPVPAQREPNSSP